MPGRRRVWRPSRVALVSMSVLSSVVAGAAEVLVGGVGARRGSAKRLGVEAVAQDRLDGAIRQCLDRQRPPAGRLDALGAVALGEADDAQAAAIALLGMRPRLQD